MANELTVNFGGATFNKEEVKSTKVIKEDGATRYVAELTNGAILKFPAQKTTNGSYASGFGEAGAENHSNTYAYGFMGLEICGVQEDDDVKIERSKECYVNYDGVGVIKQKPVSKIRFGGVQIDENEVTNKQVKKENGAIRYIVKFKNGIVAKFPRQKDTNRAEISADPESAEMKLDGCAYVSVDATNTKKIGWFKLDRSVGCTLNVSNTHHDLVTIQDGNKRNIVIQDKKDSTWDHTANNGKTAKVIEGEGKYRQE